MKTNYFQLSILVVIFLWVLLYYTKNKLIRIHYQKNNSMINYSFFIFLVAVILMFLYIKAWVISSFFVYFFILYFVVIFFEMKYQINFEHSYLEPSRLKMFIIFLIFLLNYFPYEIITRFLPNSNSELGKNLMHITSLDKEKNDRNFGKLIATFPLVQFQNNIFKMNLNAESSLIYYEKSRNHKINNNLTLSKEYLWYFDVFNVLFDKMPPNCLDGLILRSSNGVNYIYSRASKYLIQAEFSKLRSDNNYYKYYESLLFAKNQAIYKVFEKNDSTVFKISLNKFLTLPSRYIYLKVTSTKKLRQANARFGDLWNSTLVKKSINNKNILDVYTYEILLESEKPEIFLSQLYLHFDGDPDGQLSISVGIFDNSSQYVDDYNNFKFIFPSVSKENKLSFDIKSQFSIRSKITEGIISVADGCIKLNPKIQFIIY